MLLLLNKRCNTWKWIIVPSTTATMMQNYIQINMFYFWFYIFFHKYTALLLPLDIIYTKLTYYIKRKSTCTTNYLQCCGR